MNKKALQEMSLEELWELFPIELVPHQEIWEKQFIEEKKKLYNILSAFQIKRISHIGSTAIKNIYSKPIIDIWIEISKEYSIERVKDALEKSGYLTMSMDKGRISLNKGYSVSGFEDEVFHIHLRYAGDNDELYFRDYLNINSEIALDYQKLKIKLLKDFKYNRDLYTKAKTDFISKYTEIAKEECTNNY